MLPPGCCCVLGISGDYSGFSKNRGPLSHQGTQWEQVADSEVDGLDPDEQDSDGRHEMMLEVMQFCRKVPSNRQHHVVERAWTEKLDGVFASLFLSGSP